MELDLRTDGTVNQAEVVFFFQAEDGIRDKLVTGVQTCALPISEQRVLDRLFVVHGFAPAGSTQGHGGHRQKIDAGQDPIVLRDEGGTDVLRLRVEAPAVVLLQVVALHQVELEIWRELSPVALLEATEDRDEGAP